MKKLLLVLALLLAPSFAWAQCNGVFPNNTTCANATGVAALPKPTPNSTIIVPPNTLTNAQLAQMPANTVKCNPTGSTANAQDCTALPTNATAANVKCDGVTDDTAAINAALAAHASVVLPAGSCITSGPININNALNYLIGQGPTATTIRSSAASQPVISVSGTAGTWGVSNMTILHSVTATAGGDGIVTTSVLTNNAWITNVITELNYNGLNLGTCVYGIIENVISQLNQFHGVVMTASATNGGLQWQLNQVISQSNVATGFTVQNVTGPAATTVGFWNNIATAFNSGFGIVFQGLASNPIANIRVSNLFAGQDGNSEIFLNTFDVALSHIFSNINLELAGTSPTGPNLTTPASGIGHGFELTANNSEVFITNCMINAMSGSGIQSQAKGLNVQNCAILNNSSNGISIAAGGVYAQNNRIFNTAGAAQKIGIALQAGTTLNSLLNNDLVGPNGVGNATFNISNASTALNNIIENNNGFNPQGATGITVGASPFTYRAGPTGEQVFIIGGTITALNVFGAAPSVTTNSFYLGPNQFIVVTYTAAPTMATVRQ
jgi:hypothetical protein